MAADHLAGQDVLHPLVGRVPPRHRPADHCLEFLVLLWSDQGLAPGSLHHIGPGGRRLIPLADPGPPQRWIQQQPPHAGTVQPDAVGAA
ncbi:hypothetical protein [Synechococcus sp. ROS8604]|uniref:hypothetical protein n=1 Tax=Synechococcus sp. ROS8604 TaxID=1442557 RepID=UPI002106412F|nr:hypothetical protein [Synechococcus sp. ROS8604]